ncbi:uncharacterized protein F5147DRAFT_779224 [Suillus discolor]|uniref:Uncharacterized protein n=1 Tax=Suillus discolor TaxID=1912936 RepID=A0A9P7EW35_9AGAM|nr:uncharacterized protein F5147DRAFT_779224 [Suillus discolor]KAG2093709.1 hypothetical protein F5147DRAFT_779224 [Suillus discolor]
MLTQRRIKNHLKLAQNAQANQTPVEPNTMLAMTDTATTSEPGTVPPRKSKNVRKRNATSRADFTSTVNLASMANPSQVTMDSQLKEMLALMQKEIAEIRGKNERILGENESMRGEIKSIRSENKRILTKEESMCGEIERITNENKSLRKDNECIDDDLAIIRKDLDAARVQHTQDIEALREVTMSLVPLHLRDLLDRARRKGLEHLGYETWEGLRDSRSVYQLSNTIFDALKWQGQADAELDAIMNKQWWDLMRMAWHVAGCPYDQYRNRYASDVLDYGTDILEDLAKGTTMYMRVLPDVSRSELKFLRKGLSNTINRLELQQADENIQSAVRALKDMLLLRAT